MVVTNHKIDCNVYLTCLSSDFISFSYYIYYFALFLYIHEKLITGTLYFPDLESLGINFTLAIANRDLVALISL